MSKWSAWPCDEIKDLSEIRQRHARDEASSSLWERNPYVMHRDREWLLSEVKRQGAEIERLRAAATSAGAALAAAIELLERGREDAPSKRMFSQMLADYRVIVARTRKALEGKP